MDLSESEIAGFSKDIAEILAYFETLKEVNTEGVKELIHPLEAINDFREDEPEQVAPEESRFLVSEAPEVKGDYIRVKKILQ